MSTDCTPRQLEFQGWGRGDRRRVVADFAGGTLTSDGGVLLLGEVERQRQIVARFAGCFRDYREPSAIEHGVEELLSQRVLGLALGYEDLNDHEELRVDPLLATVVGKADPSGQKRKRQRDRGTPLAGKSTLNRLEGSIAVDASRDRYKRIAVDSEAVDRFFVEVFLDTFEEAPERIILDLDATDDPLHGNQEGRFFHGYYGCYCYLPLYVFCGQHLLCARLRRSNIDASEGAVAEVERIVGQIRERFPEVEIWLRADSGFAREELMAWCESHGVGFCLGLARNARLERALGEALEEAERRYQSSQRPERLYEELSYRTRKSWSRQRRVVAKAEFLAKGRNPRFVVTSLSRRQVSAGELYEHIYCARGDMENRIKEQQLHLFADRTSAHLMRVNQLRLWFSSVAYLLLAELRRLGLAGTELARAQCDTIRLKLLKIGARIRVTVRRVWVSLSSAYPRQRLFAQIYANLQVARGSPS